MADPTVTLNPADPLDQIVMEAQGYEQAAEAAANPNQEAPIDPAQAWGEIPRMLGSLLGMAMPELIPVYSDEACYNWGQGMAAVADKYGWEEAGLSKWPELALVAATLPLAVPTYLVVKHRLAEKRKAEEVERRANTVDLNDPPKPAPFKGPGGMEPGGFVEPH